MWFLLALGSAVFAALTSILAKVGIDGVNSNLATAIRTAVVLVMAWGMVFLTDAQGGLAGISRKSWLFLILSGLATGASWLCYYRALQIGEASKVVPVDKLSVVITLVLAFAFLHEKFTWKSIAGAVLITGGTLLMVTKPRCVLRNTPGSLYVFRMNFSWQRGQVMEIFPFPLGTRTIWRHLGQSKYRLRLSFSRPTICRNFRFSWYRL